MSVFIRFWGDYACFTRPEMKAERVSYDVMTPSAARGMLDAIYWHPGLKWVVEKIWVCKPVKFASIRRNEVKGLLNASAVLGAISAGSELPHCDPNQSRTQRASLILKDVEYVVQARLESFGKGYDMRKANKILAKRLERGAYHHHPSLGCREFDADFEPVDGPPAERLGDADFGWMLWDMDYDAKDGPEPLFFRAVMRDGCIDVPERRMVS